MLQNLLLAAHVLLSLATLVVGIVAMRARKTIGTHTQVGRWFHRGFFGVFVSAVMLAALDWQQLWYFAPIEPGGHLLPNNYAVTGWVKRVAGEEDIAETTDDPIQQAIAYAQQGLWYDTIESLAIALKRESDNETYQTEWRDLLEQVDLEALSTEPIIGTTDSP